MEKLEEKPDSEGRSQTLAEELKAVEADRDAEIVSAAQVLLNRINAHPDGRKIVAKLKGSGAIAVGDGAVAAGAGGVAVGGDVHGNVHTSGRKEKDK
ncbi:MAG: hypothetical protein H8D81_00660 [Deltaproteobacteria bacterium]|nr:hypothetical protein [Deltaproteobacteria bacterium]